MRLTKTRAFAKPKDVFVAMWFDDQMNDFYDNVVAKTLTACEFNPIRIDKIHQNDDINYAVLNYIQQSNFVIADLTGHRGGVYYEIGFAKALGKEVFMTCREDWVKEKEIELQSGYKQLGIHFDVDHFPVKNWNADNYLAVANYLAAKICNLIDGAPRYDDIKNKLSNIINVETESSATDKTVYTNVQSAGILQDNIPQSILDFGKRYSELDTKGQEVILSKMRELENKKENEELGNSACQSDNATEEKLKRG
jgi:nucleoside 2-deoxyribosyltransferase